MYIVLSANNDIFFKSQIFKNGGTSYRKMQVSEVRILADSRPP